MWKEFSKCFNNGDNSWGNGSKFRRNREEVLKSIVRAKIEKYWQIHFLKIEVGISSSTRLRQLSIRKGMKVDLRIRGQSSSYVVLNSVTLNPTKLSKLLSSSALDGIVMRGFSIKVLGFYFLFYYNECYRDKKTKQNTKPKV